MFRVIVSKDVAALAGGGGTRRRTVQTPKGPLTIAFGQHPTFLSSLPPEVAADPHLQVRKVSKEEEEGVGSVIDVGENLNTELETVNTEPDANVEALSATLADLVAENDRLRAENELLRSADGLIQWASADGQASASTAAQASTAAPKPKPARPATKRKAAK